MTETKSHKERIGILVAVVAIALGMFTVGSSYAAGSLWGIGSAQISIDEAAAIGIAHVKTESCNLTAISIEKDGESFIYSLEFGTEDQGVSVEIDPHTGEILSVEGDISVVQSANGSVCPDVIDDEESTDAETNDDETNDGLSVSDGDGETDDDQ